MKIYLFLQRNRDNPEVTAECFFFKWSVFNRARREMEECGQWKEMKDHQTNALKCWATPARWLSIVPVKLKFSDFSIRRWIGERCHWQNLNEDGEGKVKGSILKHGRAWFHRRRGLMHSYAAEREIRLSWNLWTDFFGADIRVGDGDGERDITFFFACGLFALWISFENFLSIRLKHRIQFGSLSNAKIIEAVSMIRHKQWKAKVVADAYCHGVPVRTVLDALAESDLKRSRESYRAQIERLIDKGYLRIRDDGRLDTSYEATWAFWPRKTGVSWHDGTLWFQCWARDDWDCDDPWWMRFNFCPADFFFGKDKYSSRELLSVGRSIRFPEGVYEVHVRLTEDSWKRPRWPWAKRIRRAHMECPIGIPIPGKGENSWDCDEDATYGLTTPASTVGEALNKLRENVMKTRERRGGKNWVPEKAKS